MEESLVSSPLRGRTAHRWTPEQDAVLRHGRENGKSSSQIGYELGVSRNAAIGRAKRLGLERLAPSGPYTPKEKPQQKMPMPKIAYWRLPEKTVPIFRPPEIQYLDKRLSDLTDKQCHFIARDRSLYCGAPIRAGNKLPYCEYCHSIMYTPAQSRRATR